MGESKHVHKLHGDRDVGPIHHGHPPYWRRAHRDWRTWFCVIAMLFAMAVYLLTGDLIWRFHAQRGAPVPAAGANQP